MEFKDYYATLGIAKGASEADIKRAYRKLAREHHPDLNPGDTKAEARFKGINEAYEVLGDTDKRRKYDDLGANWRDYERAAASGGGPRGGSGGPKGRGGRYRTMTPEEMEAAFGGQDPFSDFFHTFFSGGGFEGTVERPRGASSRRGQDVEQAVDMTLEEAFRGTTRRVVSNRDGTERSFEVRIPAGVKDGAKIRAAGEGGAGARGGGAGDLFLTVRLRPDARFERKGQDLYQRADVPVTTAVLGGEISVPTLAGSQVRLKVPALTAHGRTFRLKGHGMPVVGRPDERGDMYVTAQLQIPAELSDAARTHYEALRELEDGSR